MPGVTAVFASDRVRSTVKSPPPVSPVPARIWREVATPEPLGLALAAVTRPLASTVIVGFT